MPISEPTRRWLRLTPDRIVLLLLLVEGLLFLSEHFGWFAFNEHKNWTVLVAMATAGMALVLLLLWFLVSLIFGLRFQFSVRAMFFLISTTAIPCGWLAVARNNAREQIEIVQWLRESQVGSIRYGWGTTSFDAYQNPPNPPVRSEVAWLWNLLGEDFFRDVVMVSHLSKAGSDSGDALLDAQLERVKRLTRLEWLDLEGSAITDARLAQLSGLKQLRWLFLTNTPVTAAGMARLKDLVHLSTLQLEGTQVTDAGLAQLTDLIELHYLMLDKSSVTNAGLEHLKDLTQLEGIFLSKTQVTDARLENFQRLNHLIRLNLSDTQITDAGLAHIQDLTQLEDLGLNSTRITDAGLECLKGFTKLQHLDVLHTKVTADGIRLVYQRNPHCSISN